MLVVPGGNYVIVRDPQGNTAVVVKQKLEADHSPDLITSGSALCFVLVWFSAIRTSSCDKPCT